MTTDADILRANEPTEQLDTLIIEDPYRRWLDREGVKIIDEYAFEDLNTVELGPWERKGGRGAAINIPYPMLINDSHLIEIKPGGMSEPEHHLYEEIIYVLSGRGATSVWIGDGPKQTFEWKAGSMFAIPLNATYQNFNASGDEPARYLGVTTAPPMMRWFGDDDFIFNNDFVFSSRFKQDETTFSGNGKLYTGRIWDASFMPNVPDMPLYAWDARGAGGINVMFEMAGNSMKGHVSEFPVGTYKKGHRHGPGVVIIIPAGDGYSIMWQEGKEKIVVPWHEGSLFVPPNRWFHQHFNVGGYPARYLALHTLPVFARSEKLEDKKNDQIEYPDEDPFVREKFDEELAKRGQTSDMPPEAYEDYSFSWATAATASLVS